MTSKSGGNSKLFAGTSLTRRSALKVALGGAAATLAAPKVIASGNDKLLIGVLRARVAEARVVLIDQGDVSLDSPHTEAIRTLLADWDAAVLWASASNPMWKRQEDPPAGTPTQAEPRGR